MSVWWVERSVCGVCMMGKEEECVYCVYGVWRGSVYDECMVGGEEECV